jgi:hypothetical protein
LQATVKGLSTLQGQIDNNNILINGLQDKIDGINIALALKQNVIDGTCPEGQYLSGIVDDNLQCDTDKFYFGTLDAYYRYSYDYDYSSSCEYKYVYCPSDTQILDGKVTYTFNNYASSEYLNIYNNYYLVRMCATGNDYNAFEIRAFCGAVNNTTP